MTRPTILVHSGWNRYNFGDVAHTPGLLRLLADHIPEAEVWVWAARYPEWLTDYLGSRFPQVHVISGQLGGAHGVIDASLEEAFQQADLFIYNSGPIFNYGHEILGDYRKLEGWRGFDWNPTMERLAKLHYARHRGVPFGIFGQSFIYFAPPADLIVPDILSQAAFVTTRETDSLAYLHELGVEAAEMAFTPDAAWAFDLRDDDTVLPWLQGLGLEPGRYLLATTRNAPPGVDPTVDRQRQQSFFAYVVPAWMEATGLPLLLMPETAASIELNHALIYDSLPASVHRQVVLDDTLWTPAETFWTPDQAQSVIAHAHSYLNVDHHGALLALRSGVPCVHVRQPQAGRKAWIYHDLGLEDWLFDLYGDDPRAVVAALTEIHANRDSAQERTRHARQSVDQAHIKRMQAIRRLLDQHSPKQ